MPRLPILRPTCTGIVTRLCLSQTVILPNRLCAIRTMAGSAAVPLSATPKPGQTVEHDGKTYDTVREGLAYILIPPNTRTSVDPQANSSELPQNVFYNPIQQFNRDLSVLAIKAFGQDFVERSRVKHESRGEKLLAKKERKRVKKAGVERRGEGDELRTEEGAGLGQAEATLPNVQAGTGAVMDGKADNEDGADSSNLNDHAEQQTTTNTAPDKHRNGQQPRKPRFRILDALSATGLRALRYASEIPFATGITANDMDRNAVKSIRTNVEHNKLTDTITVNLGNAIGYMYQVAFPSANSHGPNHVNGKYDVIDLDPYGTAAPFIDAALQALNDGGLLCVTCTDSGVFASCGYSEKTYSLYGGMPIKGPHSHEGGLRLILHSIASTAAKYGLAIEPLLSLSIDFYVRVFVRVVKSAADVKFLAGKTMLVYGCDSGCGSWCAQMLGRNVRQTGKNDKRQENNPTFNFKHSIAQAPSSDRLCEHCGNKMHVAGPMWAGPLHNGAFVQTVLKDARAADEEVYKTKQRLEGMLDTTLEELVVFPEAETLWKTTDTGEGARLLSKTPPETVDTHPFFFIPSNLAKVIHCIAPPEAAVKGALRHAGYRATRSHCKPGSIKTDAPWPVIWEIMREWVRQKHPIREGALTETQAGWRIMQADRKSAPEANGDAEGDGVVDEHAKQSQQDPKRMKVVFDEALGRDKPGKRMVRYQQNPRENWGPMARAKGSG
ncbi:hypothetical protein BAUCODRAFT_77281 [Baudoinia panamericana UAMH 10762]|uniref:tRNA (guanine(26)-N(2))-dimethyltransferase n=1 Tax=Baudoinia panamericana (strain UAMH 10762) TaxID=717646 RepID=M2N1X2_BAUPA|nr:uncharacterized protein BAUCODRAFT_77281 [Baudoinia panamericana UAMH 10762]EMC92670.1 hypothetical protein BAUCODRAFT_77281 [Baudoinia panamericana UAMH 10762]